MISSIGVNAPNPPANGSRMSIGPSSDSNPVAHPLDLGQLADVGADPDRLGAGVAELGDDASIPGCERATTATLTPFAASMRHVAAPIPFEPPVTSATWPARSG